MPAAKKHTADSSDSVKVLAYTVHVHGDEESTVYPAGTAMTDELAAVITSDVWVEPDSE